MELVNSTQNDLNNLSYKEKINLLYSEPRQPGDVDYVSILYVLLRESYGDKAATDFISTPYIFEAKDLRPLQQRVMINKYFILMLLNWRSLNISSPVWGVLPFLGLDGDNASWLNGIYGVIFPFIRSNLILQ